jgi:hypothetical protein
LVRRDDLIEWLPGNVAIRLRALPPWLGAADNGHWLIDPKDFIALHEPALSSRHDDPRNQIPIGSDGASQQMC